MEPIQGNETTVQGLLEKRGKIPKNKNDSILKQKVWLR